MVKASDIESLFLRYLKKENNLVKAEALCLLLSGKYSKDDVISILRKRFGIIGDIDAVLNDIKALGIDLSFLTKETEDTKEKIKEIGWALYACNKDLIMQILPKARECLKLHIKYDERVRKIIQTLHKIITVYGDLPGRISLPNLYLIYMVLHGDISERAFRKLVDALIECHIVDIMSYDTVYFAPFAKILIRDFLAEEGEKA